MKGKILVSLGLLAFLAMGAWAVTEFLTYLDETRPLSCETLVTEREAQAVMNAHPDVVDRVMLTGALGVTVWPAEECPGKAYIQIQYRTAPTDIRVRKILGRTFFGVPYRLQNV